MSALKEEIQQLKESKATIEALANEQQTAATEKELKVFHFLFPLNLSLKFFHIAYRES